MNVQNTNSQQENRDEFYEIVKNRLKTSKGWWHIDDNYKQKEVYSCRDAVRFRNRLSSGEAGVPLWVELKSQLIKIRDIYRNNEFYVAMHSRANMRFDLSLLPAILGLEAKNVIMDNFIGDNDKEPENVVQNVSSIFGLVNPLNVDKILSSQGMPIHKSKIIQIFDTSLLSPAGYPDTVVTNAGIRKKYLEITPHALIDCVKRYFANTRIERCAVVDPIWLGEDGNFRKLEFLRFPPPSGPKIGILTGNSPETGLVLWNDFLDHYRSYYNNLADVLMPEVIVYSLPQMGLSMDLVKRKNEVWKEMRVGIRTLLKAGCKLVTVACNTTIYFALLINELCASYNAKFVSIAEACLPEIKNQLAKSANKSASVGLVGIGPVIDIKGGYSGYAKHFEENGIEVVPCDATELAWEIKRIGTNDDRDEIQSLVNKFRSLINEHLKDVNIIVLSLTEVSLIYRKHIEKSSSKHKTTKVFIDPVYELSRHLVFLYLLQGFRESKACQIPKGFDIAGKLKNLIYPNKK